MLNTFRSGNCNNEFVRRQTDLSASSKQYGPLLFDPKERPIHPFARPFWSIRLLVHWTPLLVPVYAEPKSSGPKEPRRGAALGVVLGVSDGAAERMADGAALGVVADGASLSALVGATDGDSLQKND